MRLVVPMTVSGLLRLRDVRGGNLGAMTCVQGRVAGAHFYFCRSDHRRCRNSFRRFRCFFDVALVYSLTLASGLVARYLDFWNLYSGLSFQMCAPRKQMRVFLFVALGALQEVHTTRVSNIFPVSTAKGANVTCDALARVVQQSPDMAGGVHVGNEDVDVGAWIRRMAGGCYQFVFQVVVATFRWLRLRV